MSSLFVGVDIVHRLAAGVRFFDIFTGETVRIPLTVTIPALGLQAFHASTDDTYRFLVSQQELPSGGPFDIHVDIARGEYEAREPMQVSLPLVIGHAPPIVRADYLLEFPLWPTRLRKIAPGETAVTGRIVSGGATDVAGLRVFLFEPPGPPGLYGYTNGAGEFLIRLPQLRAHMSGPVPILTATLDIEIRDPSLALVTPVIPGSILVDLGRSSLFEFNVP